MRGSSLCISTLSVGVLTCQGVSAPEALHVLGSARSAYLDCFLEHFKVA
jgi:hypothetical protein